ncbi:MAG: MFS transporter [Anaerolineaceae bacterium]|nr:MFS transporter [Anaerolineaceae bacterium]
MNNKAISFFRQFPTQFWLLIIGLFIYMTGSGFIWPFIAIYMGDKLNISLSMVSAILTLRAGATLFSSFFIGPVTDKAGRKIVLIISLFFGAISFFFLDYANTLFVFAILMIGWGATQPLIRISSQAMIADMVPPENRLSAYSLQRISMNVGVAFGPVIGGYLAKISYSFTFYIAAICFVSVAVMMMLFIKETLSTQTRLLNQKNSPSMGIKSVFHDKVFIWFSVGILVVSTMSSQVFVLLSSFLKQNFSISETQSGQLMAINALMIISLQFFISRKIKNQHPMWLMVIGAALYIAGVSSIALGTQYWHFAICMVILTCGELVIAPTATTFTANHAPDHIRGSYMSIFGLANGVGYGMGPVIGALFNDNISPSATWYGSGLVGIISVIIFIVLSRKYNPNNLQTKCNDNS